MPAPGNESMNTAMLACCKAPHPSTQHASPAHLVGTTSVSAQSFSPPVGVYRLAAVVLHLAAKENSTLGQAAGRMWYSPPACTSSTQCCSRLFSVRLASVTVPVQVDL